MAEEKESVETRILVVDDEIGMREGCRRALAMHGYAVDAADSLSTAYSLVAKRPYDLFLVDVMLPDGSGLSLVESILQRDRNAVCVVITGFGSIEMAVEAVRRGAYDFLSKPFTSDELVMSVNQGLERRRLRETEARAEALAQEKVQLERLDELKSQFMLTVAHELRAPVAAAQSYLNLISRGYVPEDEMEFTLGRVQERLKEMLALIGDLLELAGLRQAKDHLRARTSPQPMVEVLRDVCDKMRVQAEEKGQRFHVEIRAEPIIVANRDHLEAVWTNLISNAIKYTPEGGEIVVSLESNRDQLIGSVTDSGMGISEAEQERLFQDFYRTDQAKASGQIGTGLGLAIVKQIVESYGGEVSVTSEVGAGSRFTFLLPIETEGDTTRD